MITRAREEAEGLLRNNGIVGLPVSMTQVCASLGIPLKFDLMCGLKGCFLRSKSADGAIIVVNDNLSREEQRFSVAHELGHLEFHCDTYSAYDSFAKQHSPDSSIEAEADLFARELLMPWSLLHKQRMSVKELAKCCIVPLYAARIRIAELE